MSRRKSEAPSVAERLGPFATMIERDLTAPSSVAMMRLAAHELRMKGLGYLASAQLCDAIAVEQVLWWLLGEDEP